MSDIEGGQTSTGGKAVEIVESQGLRVPENQSYAGRLFTCATSDVSICPDEANYLAFRELQRLNITNLQNKIIRCNAAFFGTGSDEVLLAELDSILERYSEAYS
jgi:hypothetical protein